MKNSETLWNHVVKNPKWSLTWSHVRLHITKEDPNRWFRRWGNLFKIGIIFGIILNHCWKIRYTLPKVNSSESVGTKRYQTMKFIFWVLVKNRYETGFELWISMKLWWSLGFATCWKSSWLYFFCSMKLVFDSTNGHPFQQQELIYYLYSSHCVLTFCASLSVLAPVHYHNLKIYSIYIPDVDIYSAESTNYWITLSSS